MSDELEDPIIDLDLQVRLMNLVMGEASDFERDQLMQSMEQQPEVAAYYEHLVHLHGMMTEVGAGEFDLGNEPTKADNDWKLSAERRQQVIGVINGQKSEEAQDVVVLKSLVPTNWTRWTTVVVSLGTVCVLLCLLMLPSIQQGRLAALQVNAARRDDRFDIDTGRPSVAAKSSSTSEFSSNVTGFAGSEASPDNLDHWAMRQKGGMEGEWVESSAPSVSFSQLGLPSLNAPLTSESAPESPVAPPTSGLVDGLSVLDQTKQWDGRPEGFESNYFSTPSSTLEQFAQPGAAEINGPIPSSDYKRLVLGSESGGSTVTSAIEDKPKSDDYGALGGVPAQGLGMGSMGGMGRGGMGGGGMAGMPGGNPYGGQVDGRQSGGMPYGGGSNAGFPSFGVQDNSGVADKRLRGGTDVTFETEPLEKSEARISQIPFGGFDGAGLKNGDYAGSGGLFAFGERDQKGESLWGDSEGRQKSLDDVVPSKPQSLSGNMAGSAVEDLFLGTSPSTSPRKELDALKSLEEQADSYTLMMSQTPKIQVPEQEEELVQSQSETASEEDAVKLRVLRSDVSELAIVEKMGSMDAPRDAGLEGKGENVDLKSEVDFDDAIAIADGEIARKKLDAKKQGEDEGREQSEAVRRGTKAAEPKLSMVTRAEQESPSLRFRALELNDREEIIKGKSGPEEPKRREHWSRSDSEAKLLSPTDIPDRLEALKKRSSSKTTEALEEQSASVEAFSTFSLHVSDVSFKLAQAALSQGQWPDASKIRIEEFVNAIDYHDALPIGRQKVACQVEQAIHPFLMQRNLLRVSMRTAATGRSQSVPLRLTLLLDNSGSMERPDRRQVLLRAMDTLTKQLQPSDQVTLISFANTPRLLADQVSGDQASSLLNVIESLPSEGGTNIEAALLLAREKAIEHQLAGAQNRIVLLTDGAVNLGNANPESLAKIVTQLRDAGVAFDAAGISAQDLNDEVLEALTRQGDGRYYLLDSLEAADETFAAQIAGALRPSAKNVKVQIEFNPERVGNYKLLGFEQHRLQREDFRNDQVDAAELAAAEAGVAVYQFEAKPNGKGDVGVVFVRFQDVSTGRMIEERWPILYEPSTPRLDQATSSMQLAASAALLAAKLRGGPLAESVDLPELQTLLSKMPESILSQPRVEQLRTMIRQAQEIK